VVGLTVILGPVLASLQEYVPPPLVVKMVLAPLQIVVLPVITGIKLAATVTATVAVPIQPPVVTVTV
jgi:hypothetical protein